MKDWLIYHVARSDSAGRLIFWRTEARGYTDNLQQAGGFYEAYAKQMQDISHGESMAVPRSLIETLTKRLIVDLGDGTNRVMLGGVQ